MKKYLRSLGVLWLLGWGAVVAHAHPALTYGFAVQSLNCSDPLAARCAAERDFYTRKLESMTLSFAPAVPGAGQANLLIEMDPMTATTLAYSNSGFAGLDLSQWGVFIDLAAQRCLPHCMKLEVAFDLPGALTGLFRLDTWNDNVFMSAGAANLWSGYINSDGPFMTAGEDLRPTFTGAWRLQPADVPEPGVVALLGVALCGLLLVRAAHRRKPVRR